MFKDWKVWKLVCLVVLVAVVVSFIQLRPTELSGQKLNFVIEDGFRMRVSFEGTILHFRFRSLEPFELVEEEEGIYEPWIDEGEGRYLHKDSPVASEYPSYWDTGMLTEGTYNFQVKGSDVHVYLVEEFQPYEIDYIGEDLTIEVFIFPTFSKVGLTLAKYLGMFGLLFVILLLTGRLFKKIKISWEKREASFEKSILFIILVISIFALVLLSIVQTSKKEYVGDEIVFSVPAHWFLQIKTPSWTYVYVESEAPMHFVLEEENPASECESYAFENNIFNFVGSPFGSVDIIADEANKYFFKDGYFFENYIRSVCEGEYTWKLLGEKTFLSVGLFDESTEEISVEVYPSQRAVYQTIFNNLKTILLIDVLIFGIVFAARRVKIKRIE